MGQQRPELDPQPTRSRSGWSSESAPAVRVPTDWSLIPAGLSTGDQFRLIFLSSTKRDGSSTDIATYNTFIQTRAAAGHTDIQAYSTWFSVVGCTADSDAIVNTGTTGGGGVAHLLAQRGQGRRPLRGFLRRGLGRGGRRQERVRRQRPRHQPRPPTTPSPAATTTAP